MVSITVTIFGSSRNEHILRRSAAQPGDKVAVTGYLGAAAAGLKMLRKNIQLDPEATSQLRQAFLRPNPRVAEGQLLAGHGVKTAIDISDGLISDLGHICESSHVGARIEVDRLPVAPEVKANFPKESVELALSGGEDYELLFTASAQTIAKVTSAASCPVTVIGDITADKRGRIDLIDSQGRPFHLSQGGWDHFAAE